MHPKIVQELLGHTSIRLTLDTYSHYLPDMQEKAVDAMRSALETPFKVSQRCRWQRLARRRRNAR